MVKLTEQETVDCKEIIRQWNVRRITFRYLIKNKKIIVALMLAIVAISDHFGPQILKFTISNIAAIVA